MKLYTGDLSPYSAKVRMQIYAMGITDISFELPTEFFLGRTPHPPPLARPPVLETDEGIIPESEVIAEKPSGKWTGERRLLAEDLFVGLAAGVTEGIPHPDHQHSVRR